MATSSTTSPVTRETPAYVREKGLRQVIVTITGGLLELRCKGLRSRETLDIGSLYTYAVRMRIMRDKAERAKARKAKRSPR